MTDDTQRKGHTYMRKGVLPVTAGLCVLAVTVMMIALLSGGRQESFSPPPFDAAAQTGAPEVPENAGYGEMDAKAFRFSAAGENTVWLKVRILDENGDILGESGLIRPGEYVRSVELNSVPQQTTAVSLKIMAYEPETYYSAGSAVLNTTLKIA